MKRMLLIVVGMLFFMGLTGCDVIEQQIEKERERIESLELEDYRVDIPARSVSLKITSDVDEQLLEEVKINGERLELVSEGDDWYLLADVPIEKAYEIETVYYRSDLGPRMSFDVDFSITLSEALEYLSDDELFEVEESLTLAGYTFMVSEEELVEIDTEAEYTLDIIDEWVWLILEDDVPLFVVFEYEDTLYVIDVPEEVDEYLE